MGSVFERLIGFRNAGYGMIMRSSVLHCTVLGTLGVYGVRGNRWFLLEGFFWSLKTEIRGDKFAGL